MLYICYIFCKTIINKRIAFLRFFLKDKNDKLSDSQNDSQERIIKKIPTLLLFLFLFYIIYFNL